ncbi:class I SAM-dependent methyltransferase [Brachybacterium sp. AOP35-5H-19]|uniref:class I SAM-dependent methyltransferase n=1 Tax=Brachybacterium sp. AOP35-5H-19 TaxID=3457685 RepID=UPI0040337103
MTSTPWNVRTTENPLIRWLGRRLTVLNARHPWNHNAHFHRWILRSVPAAATTALDVGCGRGDLITALAGVIGPGGRVDGIDPDPEMARLAASEVAPIPQARIHRRTLAEHAAWPVHAGCYDAITMVASLHHMDLDQALNQAKILLRPGGRLLVVTLTMPVTTLDQLWDLGSAVTNPLIGLVKHPRPARGPDPAAAVPVADPAWSLDELRERAGRVLPGVRIRRREGFRVTLLWQKPAVPISRGCASR